MDPLTLGILVVAGTVTVATFIWYKIAVWQTNHRKPAKGEEAPELCDSETCDHEWQFWDDEFEGPIDYNSYGSSDTFGTVVSHHAFCPKCGTHEVTAEVLGE